MERAKQIATAIIGVAFAANYCELAVAQTSNRFIRQPAKAPINPTSTSAALVTPTPTTALPSTQVPVPTATPAKDLDGAFEAEVAKEAAKLAITEQHTDTKPEAPLRFPSLMTLANSPDLVFDSFESFATVPAELNIEKSTDQKSILDLQPIEPQPKLLVPEALTSPENPTRTAAPRSGQLQWTSRGNVSHSRSESYNANSGSQPHFDTNTSRNAPSFNPRINTIPGPQATFSQQDPRSPVAAKQPSDSTKESKNEKVDEPVSQERVRASLVSARITSDPRFATQSPSQSSVTRIESPQGWQAIGTRLSEHVKRCESLLGRGAFCSAREEAEAASMLLYRHIDLHDNLFRCEPAVQSANQALHEAEDFLVVLRSTADGESIRRLVNAHETPVLKNKNLAGMSPLTAAQHYRQFAESQLVEAAQGHPWASELLYTVGRTYQAEADANSSHVDVLRMKSMAYYRASRTTMPSNAVTCNQLGYLLLQMDRNDEARESLIAAVTLKQDEASLSNLAEASRRLGDMQTVAWAAQSVAAIRRQAPPASPVPPYIEVSQEDFIAISPREIGPKTPSDASPNVGPKSPVRSAATPNANQLR